MKTIRINYYVANKKKAVSSLLISISWDRKRLQIGIGLSIETSTFDYKKGRIKPGAPHSMEKNRFMENLSQDIRNYYYRLVEQNQQVDAETLKEYVKSKISNIETKEVKQSPPVKVVEPEPVIPMHNLTILQLWEQFIEERRNNQKFTKASIKSYVTMKHHLERFLIATNYDLRFDTINESFCDKIVFYLAEEANLVNSTIERFFRVFKTLLNWAVENEFTTNIRWKKALKQVVKDYKLKTESTIIALTNEEIALFESHVPSSPALRNARDIFLIQIFTGLRVSDIMKLKAGNISLSEKKITIYPKKTIDPVIINIPQRLLNVLNRYPALRFPSMSDQRFNILLKELSREAGLSTEIIIPSFYAKRRVDKTYKRWELISSHVARNTFVTYLIKKGVVPEMVMQITGHKSRAAFERYVKIAKAEAQHAVQLAWDE